MFVMLSLAVSTLIWRFVDIRFDQLDMKQTGRTTS